MRGKIPYCSRLGRDGSRTSLSRVHDELLQYYGHMVGNAHVGTERGQPVAAIARASIIPRWIRPSRIHGHVSEGVLNSRYQRMPKKKKLSENVKMQVQIPMYTYNFLLLRSDKFFKKNIISIPSTIHLKESISLFSTTQASVLFPQRDLSSGFS